ncbi:MAG: hypothetical protein ACRDZU_12630, partial [Acidimicrobiales bacterium]
SCDGGLPKRATITASVTDASPVTVVLFWTGGAGNGQVNMTPTGSTYSGSFGSFPTGGTETYYVTATDSAGNQTTSAPGAVDVLPCPQ